MDFFKSVFTEEPQQQPLEQNPNITPSESSTTPNVWSFGGLIKTITSKSESVIQTYKKDLDEFTSELKKETSIIRRVVKDLPASLEVGASVAQESLESVGQAIDDLGGTVAGFITHGKDVLLSNVDNTTHNYNQETEGLNDSSSLIRGYSSYSRFESQVRAVQSDLSTYCEEVEDLEEFGKWKSGFVLGERDEEIDGLLSENGGMDSVYRKLVPKTIDDETFWSRYFYKVYKLTQVEEARANLVKRAIEGEDEELSWDVDDDEEEETSVLMSKGETSENKSEEKNVDRENEEKEIGDGISEEEGPLEGKSDLSVFNDSNLIGKLEDKSVLDGKNEQAESCKDSDVSVVSSQPSLPEEQDLSWDEIEDLSGIDEKKASTSDSPNGADLRKRLSAADDDEDLSWDIEDDD